MKISSAAIDAIVALLVASSVTAFVPNSHGANSKLVQNEIIPTSRTALFSSQDSGPSSSPVFPFTDKEVRFAYDEWRLIYAKGNFDPVRFEQFKRNHRTLILSNLNAREKAARDGRPMPQWMSLNEYGDYSMEEYEAMLRGEEVVVNRNSNMAYSSSSLDAGEQPVLGTQQVLPQQPARATIRVNDDYAKHYRNGQAQEYQDQYGRTIRPSLEQGETLVRTASSSPTSAGVNINSNYANNIGEEDAEPSSERRGTLLIPKEDGNERQRGTQVISSASSARGTQVISSSSSSTGTQVISSSSPAVRGTQVISSSSPAVRGTQVIQRANGASPAQSGTQGVGMSSNGGSNQSYGTQVINKVGGSQPPASKSYGTQVISSSGNGRSDVRGTQVIQSANGGDNRPIPPNDEDSSAPSNRGTLIIPRGESDGNGSARSDGGTLVVGKDDKESWANILGKIFEDSEKEEEDVDESDEVGKRGTLVIKRSIELPEKKSMKNPFSFFGSAGGKTEKKSEVSEDQIEVSEEQSVVSEEPKMEEKQSGFNSFFNFGSSDTEKETKAEVDEEPAEEEKPSGGNSFFNFGSTSGKEKEKKIDVKIEAVEEPAPEEKPSGVSSFFNFLTPKDTVANEIAEDVAQVLEEKGNADTDSDTESKSGSNVFSFFGGSVSKANPRPVRTTITLQQPAAGEKKVPAAKSQRKTKLIPEKPSEDGTPSILSFFGGAKKVTEEETARDPSSRPTLIVNKPKKSSVWSPFSTKKKEDETPNKSVASPTSKDDVTAKRIARQREGVERAAKRKAEIAQEREQRRLELEQKRKEATQRREAQAQAQQRSGKGTRSVSAAATATDPKSKSKPKSGSPFQFMGAVGKQATPPTLKKWKQNRDGTITGLIYDSKNFKDGTRITTSPIPKGAKGGSVVKTSGGSKYTLT
eukprot:jgi/Psemu1/322244/estExt_fgenesh1_pg.C_230002